MVKIKDWLLAKDIHSNLGADMMISLFRIGFTFVSICGVAYLILTKLL
jgi:hypothetical protein